MGMQPATSKLGLHDYNTSTSRRLGQVPSEMQKPNAYLRNA